MKSKTQRIHEINNLFDESNLPIHLVNDEDGVKAMGTIYQITPTTRYSISIISKKATSVLEVAFSILIVVPF